MTIAQVVALVEHIYTMEGWVPNAASSREERNEWFAFAMGCVHWGHATYNPLDADPRWHIKSTSPGSQQSDDVAVLMPSGDAWDTIIGCGTNSYAYEADYIGTLLHQHIYPPPKPDGAVTPPPSTVPPYPGDAYYVNSIGKVLEADYAEANQTLNAGSATWFGRVDYDHFVGGMTMDASGWQPIETAKQKVHERVLLWWTTRGACSGYFDVDGDRNTSGWRGDQDLVIPRDQAKCTHWQPLPAPPVGLAQEKT